MGLKRIQSIEESGRSLVCVFDSDQSKGKELAKRMGCKLCRSYLEVTRDPKVDCVIVSTPNKYHTSISISALKNGKHVFCEKPLARTPEEALRIVKAAERNRVFLKTGSNVRYFPNVIKAKELLDNSEIGETMFMRGWIGNSGLHLKKPWFSDPDMAGGGTFLDNGTHMLDLTRWFLGEMEECTGFVSTRFHPVRPLEDLGMGLFKTTDGKLAFIQSSWVEWGDYFYIEIYGKKGYIRVDSRFPICKTILGKKNDIVQAFDYSKQPVTSYRLELESFVKAIHEGRQPLPSGYDGLKAVEMAHAIYQSSKMGRTIKL